MNIKEIERLWKIATDNPHHDFNWHDPAVVKFAELVAQHEREACAKICDEFCYGSTKILVEKAIRARGNT